MGERPSIQAIFARQAVSICTRNAAGSVVVKTGAAFDATRMFDPRNNPYINLLRNPDGILGEPNASAPAQGPFDNTGYYVNSISAIVNSGAGAKWTQFEGGLQYLNLRSGQPAETHGEDNLKTMELVFAAYQSASTGQAVLIN